MQKGLHTVCGAGCPKARNGIAVHVYMANESMKDRAFYNSDGSMLIGTFVVFVRMGCGSDVTDIVLRREYVPGKRIRYGWE